MTAVHSFDGSGLRADGTHSNPMFDYENLDDIHAEEISTTPTPDSANNGPPVLVPSSMFEISLGSGHGNSGHMDHVHGDHVHNHQHSHHSHSDHLPSYGSGQYEPRPMDADHVEHCHDQAIDSRMAKETRRAMIKLIIGLVLCLIFMIIEVVGGALSKSLAIFTGEFRRYRVFPNGR